MRISALRSRSDLKKSYVDVDSGWSGGGVCMWTNTITALDLSFERGCKVFLIMLVLTCKFVVLTVAVVRLHIVPVSEAASLPGPGDQRGRVGLHLAEELQDQTVLLQPPVVGEEDDGRVEDHQLDVEAVHLAQSVVRQALVEPSVVEASPGYLQPVLPCRGVGQHLAVQPGPGDGGRGVA